jgi:hypothetical protein
LTKSERSAFGGQRSEKATGILEKPGVGSFGAPNAALTGSSLPAPGSRLPSVVYPDRKAQNSEGISLSRS